MNGRTVEEGRTAARHEGELAARDAIIADLKGRLAKKDADNGHLKARLSIMSERQWAGDRRGIQALVAGGRPVRDTTGFSDGLL